MDIEAEVIRRERMWQALIDRGGPVRISAGVIRDIGMYSGAQGVYRDTGNTGIIAAAGVTVSILHTGRHYPDDLSENEIIYHYPGTRRSPLYDQNEIEATKNAGKLGIPIFIITEERTKRNVKVGKVSSWDDQSKTFLITFINNVYRVPGAIVNEVTDNEHFESTVTSRRRSKNTSTYRPGQTKFKFQVIKRYGSQCAVCGISIYSLLQAAHIIPVSDNGSDDPRNGLVLCANHHIAFDQNMFVIDPVTYQLDFLKETMESLHISYTDLNHLANKPHQDALAWRLKKV